MLAVFKFCGELITKIVLTGKVLILEVFALFDIWLGLLILTMFGAFVRGLLFSGIGGSAVSSLAGRANGKSKNKKVMVVAKW